MCVVMCDCVYVCMYVCMYVFIGMLYVCACPVYVCISVTRTMSIASPYLSIYASTSFYLLLCHMQLSFSGIRRRMWLSRSLLVAPYSHDYPHLHHTRSIHPSIRSRICSRICCAKFYCFSWTFTFEY